MSTQIVPILSSGSMTPTTTAEMSQTETATAAPAGFGLAVFALVALLVRKRRVLLGCILGFTLFGVFSAITAGPYYTATTSFLPPQSSGGASVLPAGLASFAGLSGLASHSNADFYGGLVTSETVEVNMINRFDLKKDFVTKYVSIARKHLESKTIVDTKGRDGLVRISVIDGNAKRAAELANGYVDEIQKISGTLAVTDASQRRRFLEVQLQDAKDKLSAAEEDLKRTEQRTGVLQPEGQQRLLIDTAANIRAQITAHEVQIQSMRTYEGAGNPELIQAEQELASLRAQLSRLSSANDGGDSLAPEKTQLTNAGLDYARKLREARYRETLFDILARQYEAARLDEAKEGATIQVVDRARIEDYKTGPKRVQIALEWFAAGIGVGLFWVFGQQIWLYLMSFPQYRDALQRVRTAVHSRA